MVKDGVEMVKGVIGWIFILGVVLVVSVVCACCLCCEIHTGKKARSLVAGEQGVVSMLDMEAADDEDE